MSQIESVDEEIEIMCVQKIASVFGQRRMCVCIVVSDACALAEKNSSLKRRAQERHCCGGRFVEPRWRQ
jgi:hypothetical protein